jgi:hypothetical protein
VNYNHDVCFLLCVWFYIFTPSPKKPKRNWWGIIFPALSHRNIVYSHNGMFIHCLCWLKALSGYNFSWCSLMFLFTVKIKFFSLALTYTFARSFPDCFCFFVQNPRTWFNTQYWNQWAMNEHMAFEKCCARHFVYIVK